VCLGCKTENSSERPIYNFARVHQTLRVTPAMQAGIADHHVWSIDEIVGLLD
jgi:hypothetical protein